MNLKKTLSMILSVAIVLSSMCVFASTDVKVPENLASELTELDIKAVAADNWSSTETEDITLDFGMKFSATQTMEEAEKEDYIGYIVDFRLTFDKNVTAILAGQYDTWSENWVAVKSKGAEGEYKGFPLKQNGVDFKANEPVRVMEAIDQYYLYRDVVRDVQNFNCGVKFSHETPDNVNATLELIMVPYVEVIDFDEETMTHNDHDCDRTITLSNGTKKCFKYDLDKEPIVIDTVKYVHNRTAEEKVADINANIDIIANVTDAAEKTVELIKGLNQEEKSAITPEAIKAIYEATKGETIAEDITEAAVFSADSAVVVNVENAWIKEDEFKALTTVLEVTAKDSATNASLNEVDVPVLVAIPVADVNNVKEVLHLHGDVIETLDCTKGNGVIYVQMSKFSQIALVYESTPIANDEAVLKFVPATSERGTAKFDLFIEGAKNDVVKGLLSGEFTLVPSEGHFDYEFKTVDALNLISEDLEDGKMKYEINLKSFDENNSYTVVSGTEIKLGELLVTSYGSGIINIEDVKMWRHDYTEENLTEAINVVATEPASFNIEVPTQKLTVKIDFKHRTETNNNFDYQNMWIELSGGDIDGVRKINLGADNAEVDRMGNEYYSYTCDLLANNVYNVAVKGAGYRTARYFNLNMGEEDRVLTFWNNYKDAAVEMESANGTSVGKKFNANFLAGDIVMDNYIDIYDLSAVVSYFGESNLVGVKNNYSKYDLNRDGDIDSLDVAILLDSWNK